MKCRLLIICLFWGCMESVYANTSSDTLSVFLKDLRIDGRRITSPLRGSISSTLRWNMGQLSDLPKFLGNADPLHYTQLLPGVQTCSEYDSGIHIQGCDNAHNYVSVSGVPLYNVAHLFGFFSVFNASHFSQMSFTKSDHSADFANRLGGHIDMLLPDTIPNGLTGELSVGLLSSQATLRSALGSKSAIFLSARSAYLNLLYKPWLKIEDTQLGYSFSDINLTYLMAPTYRDKVWLNMYYGDDKMSADEVDYSSDVELKWGNMLFSLQWERNTDDFTLSNTFYHTQYRNSLDLTEEQFYFTLPSSVHDWGYKGCVKKNMMSIGIDAVYHRIEPQSPSSSGESSLYSKSSSKIQHTLETSAFADLDIPLSQLWTVNMGLRGNMYRYDDTGNYYSLDPSVTIHFIPGGYGHFKLHYGVLHQYLFQAGFSNSGLPTEFWFSSDAEHRPQYAHSFSFSYDMPMFDNRFSLSFECYYKILRNQIEYEGNMLDLVTSSYDLDNFLLKGSGRNVGVNLMLVKKTGSLTGWVSYSYGRSFRKYNLTGEYKEYPANHERIHELNAVATYRLTGRWTFGSTLVYASGTPFTAPKHFYLMNNQLISEYGGHNANRLNPYFRIDLSADYLIKKRDRLEQIVNLSLYNVTMHNNDIFYRLKFYEERFAYKPVRFLLGMLPSISYHLKF